MLVKQDKLTSICITFFITLVILALSYVFDYESDLKTSLWWLTWLCIIVYAWILYSSYLISFRKINIYFSLILLTIPFYLGDQISIIFGYEERMFASDHSILDGIIPNKAIFIAMFFLIECLLFLHIGYLVGYTSPQKKVLISHADINYSEISRMNLIGWGIYFLTFIPMIVIRAYDIYMSRSMGHLAYRLSNKVNGVLYCFDYIADWFIPACLIILISAVHKRDKNIATLSIIGYWILYLLSGNRMEIIGSFFAVAGIYLYWYKIKVSKITLVKFIAIAIIGILIFQIVGAARDVSDGSGIFSLETFNIVMKKGFLYGIFETTGNTFTSIANTIRCVPDFVDYNYGKSVIGSVLYIFPRVFREPYISDIICHISAVLSPYYYGWTISGYGSSFITEAYFNWGYFAIIAVMIYGWIVGKVMSTIEQAAHNTPFLFYFCIYMLLEMALAIRNDLYFIPRHLFLYVLIPYFFTLILKWKRNR